MVEGAIEAVKAGVERVTSSVACLRAAPTELPADEAKGRQ